MYSYIIYIIHYVLEGYAIKHRQFLFKKRKIRKKLDVQKGTTKIIIYLEAETR